MKARAARPNRASEIIASLCRARRAEVTISAIPFSCSSRGQQLCPTLLWSYPGGEDSNPRTPRSRAAWLVPIIIFSAVASGWCGRVLGICERGRDLAAEQLLTAVEGY